VGVAFVGPNIAPITDRESEKDTCEEAARSEGDADSTTGYRTTDCPTTSRREFSGSAVSGSSGFPRHNRQFIFYTCKVPGLYSILCDDDCDEDG
jgi:hypothetical protein